MLQVFLLRYLAVVAGAFVTWFGSTTASATATAPATHLGHVVVFVESGSGIGINGPWPLDVVAAVARVSVWPTAQLAKACPSGGGHVLCVYRLRASTVVQTVTIRVLTYCCRRPALSPRS